MIETLEGKGIKWYHILYPTDVDLQFLMDNFQFDLLDIEDCKSTVQRPKIDIYDNYYFIILHFPTFVRNNKFLTTREAKLFWGKDYVITIGNTHWVITDFFNKAKENFQLKEELLSKGSDILLYKILERLMIETFPILNQVNNELDHINSRLFDKQITEIIERISITRKNVILLDTIFKPQLRVFHRFETGEIRGFAKGMKSYWGNILDYYQKIWDIVEDLDELIEGLSKTFDSLQTNRTNEIIKMLTIISIILLPLTFITGLYGMNIGLPLQNYPLSFLIIVGVMAVIVIFLLFFFKRNKWI